MKYFVLFIGVFCEKRDIDDVKCLETKPSPDFSPTLKYITNELVTCASIIESDSSVGADTCSLSSEGNLKCQTLNDGDECPDAPEGCDLLDASGFAILECEYKCTEPELSCATTEFPVKFVNHDDADKIYCFNQEINSCINKIVVDDDPRIDYKCSQDCGYNTDPDYTLIFDGSEFTNTYTGENAIGFDCEESNKKCDCDNSASTLICDANAYTDDCPDSDKCRDGICYDAPPFFDYKFENCTITNEDPDIQYCTNDVKVHFPCGESVPNDCKEEAGEINCYCDVATEQECATLAALVEGPIWEGGKCVVKDVQDEVEKMDCEFVCFDDTFQNEDCKSGAAFDHEYWQCFDDFTTVKIVVPPEDEVEKSNLKAVIDSETTYDFFSDCTKPACPAGICTCEDTERDGASAFCKSKGDFHVTKIEQEEDNSRTDAVEYEFECLSFNEEYSAINIIESDVSRESECRELLPPSPDIDAKCPAVLNCKTVESTKTGLPHVGFSDCQCEKKCSYKCAYDNYDAEFEDGVFPEDWNQEEDDNVYTSYKCILNEDYNEKEDDNLVMIICTSIFVPLGVAGIAAGVYFFFFHESSEVAPVETDNELASTRSSEHNPTDENKEETRSEITKDN